MTAPSADAESVTTLRNAPDYVSRGGLKLHHAVAAFGLDLAGMTGVDLGCSTGGFTDCLLHHGASSVHAVDTAYGELAWKLRQDERVRVLERSNALHVEVPGEVRDAGGVDVAVIDLGWTPQRLAIPAAGRWIKPGGVIISLIKPHYEAGKDRLSPGGVLDDEDAKAWTEHALREIAELDYTTLAVTRSPVQGGKRSKKKNKGKGNAEWLALIVRTDPSPLRPG